MARVIELFDSIWGVGIESATKFYQMGFRTLDDLRKNTHILTEWQKIGLKYHEEFEQRIPRDDVTAIVEIVKAKINELSDLKDVYEAVCCGSYRR
jgi:Fingers domain of DNA polymerase lambda.